VVASTFVIRRDLLNWAWTKPDPIRFRATIIVANLYRLEHWPDDRLMQFETLRNITDLERLCAGNKWSCPSSA